MAYVVPFGLFLGGLGLVSLVKGLGGGSRSLFFAHPELWIYPLQTVVCGAAVLVFRREYQFDFGRGFFWAVAAGLLSLAIWVSPQWLFGAKPRAEGFNPELLAFHPSWYWAGVGMRFLRLVVVVPLIEEIFWRGFLMRYLIDERFDTVPFGKYKLVPFAAVAVLFGMEHWGPDLIPGVLTGVLFNFVAVRTRSLGACVYAHAITNFGLGLYIMATKQWGFW